MSVIRCPFTEHGTRNTEYGTRNTEHGIRNMETIEDIRRRIKNAGDLHSIVRTMRALAMTSIRQYERAVESLTDYYRTTELGLHVVLTTAVRQGYALPPAPRRPLAERGTGILVFGSDQSMCGQFNEQIADYTAEKLSSLGIPADNLHVIAVGSRVVPPLAGHGFNVLDLFSVPGSVTAITPMVQEILLRSDQWQNPATQPIIEQIFLFYNRLESTIAYRPRMQRLLPHQPQTTAPPGTPTLALARPAHLQHGLAAPPFRPAARTPFRLPLSRLRRIAGQRKRRPPRLHASRRTQHRRAARRTAQAVSPSAAKRHHQRTVRHHLRF
jgi:F0F1-type ATP synthase gamma subunit